MEIPRCTLKKKFLQRKKNNPGVPTTQFALLFQHKTKSEMGDNKIEGRLHYYLFIHSNLDITNLNVVNFAIYSEQNPAPILRIY